MPFGDLESAHIGHADVKLLYDKWWNKALEPTQSFTVHQILWIFLQTIVCSAICFGVNFALCTLAFYGKPDPVFFEFPESLVTSYALTVVLEITLNWFINGSVMSYEVLHAKVAPLSPKAVFWWPKIEESKLRWYFDTTTLVVPTTPATTKWQRLWNHTVRGIPWHVYSFIVSFPLFCGLTYVFCGNRSYNDFPQPEILVGAFGVLLAVTTQPIWAVITLTNIGERMIKDNAY